jgi:hypothetical protein
MVSEGPQRRGRAGHACLYAGSRGVRIPKQRLVHGAARGQPRPRPCRAPREKGHRGGRGEPPLDRAARPGALCRPWNAPRPVPGRHEPGPAEGLLHGQGPADARRPRGPGPAVEPVQDALLRGAGALGKGKRGGRGGHGGGGLFQRGLLRFPGRGPRPDAVPVRRGQDQERGHELPENRAGAGNGPGLSRVHKTPGAPGHRDERRDPDRALRRWEPEGARQARGVLAGRRARRRRIRVSSRREGRIRARGLDRGHGARLGPRGQGQDRVGRGQVLQDRGFLQARILRPRRRQVHGELHPRGDGRCEGRRQDAEAVFRRDQGQRPSRSHAAAHGAHRVVRRHGGRGPLAARAGCDLQPARQAGAPLAVQDLHPPGPGAPLCSRQPRGRPGPWSRKARPEGRARA